MGRFHVSLPPEQPKREQRERPKQGLPPGWERGGAMRWTPPTTDEGDASGEALPWLGGGAS